MSTKIRVLNYNGDKLYDAAPAQAARMIALHQAKYTADHRCLKLIGFVREHEHPCRTHTSRGGLLAAIGRGQQYTTATHGRVDGFKRIFSEDRGFFQAAVLDCLNVAGLQALRNVGFFCDAHHGQMMEVKA